MREIGILREGLAPTFEVITITEIPILPKALLDKNVAYKNLKDRHTRPEYNYLFCLHNIVEK